MDKVMYNQNRELELDLSDKMRQAYMERTGMHQSNRDTSSYLSSLKFILRIITF